MIESADSLDDRLRISTTRVRFYKLLLLIMTVNHLGSTCVLEEKVEALSK
jgi:hypothetical protein